MCYVVCFAMGRYYLEIYIPEKTCTPRKACVESTLLRLSKDITVIVGAST
jgi:hypothetical protein